MSSNGSFYQNGLPLSTLETGLGNVSPGAPVTNKANGSMYISGTAYSTLMNADALLAAITAQQALSTADAAAALASQTAAALSQIAAAASVVTLGTTALLKGNNLSDLSSVPTSLTNLGLQNVTNTSDINKPVSTAQATADALVASNAAAATAALSSATTTALALKAPLASPSLTGVPVAPTAAALTNTTQLATTAFVDAARVVLVAVDALKAPLASPALTGVPVAPTAAALNNSTQLATTAYADAAVSTLSGTTTTALALKAPLASPALTGTPTAPTATALDNTTKLATTAYADGAVSTLSGAVTTALGLKAPLASPTFTGVPAAPTATVGTNTTQLATTAFVIANSTAISSSELAYWTDKAAQLDPAAYVYWKGATWSVTVPTGETWYAVNAWNTTLNSSSSWFQRNLATDECTILPAGSVIASNGNSSAFLYVCRPALASSDAKYADPKALYYTRLNALRNIALSTLSASITAGSAINTVVSANFPTTFNDAIASQISMMDISWCLFTDPILGGGLNSSEEISDTHQVRLTRKLLTPFARAAFPGIESQAANVSGNATDVSLAGEGVLNYFPLPDTWRATPSKPYRTAVLADTPKIYYPMAEQTGTTVTDLGSAALNATYTGTCVLGIAGATGDGDTAVKLNDSTALVSIPNSTNFDFAGGDFTMEGWVWFDSLPTSSAAYTPWVINGWISSSVSTKLSFLLGVFSNKLNFIVEFTDATSASVSSTISLTAGTYYHVICGRSSGNLFIRVVNKETRQTTAITKNLAQRSTEGVWLGNGTNSGVDRTYTMNGRIDEFALYNSALSDTRANAHHSAALGWQ